MRKRSRIDGVKLPFVVTMTMAAGACGGTVTGRDGDRNAIGGGSGGQGGNSGQSTATGGSLWIASGGSVNPPPPLCPPEVPTNGTPCFAPPSCSYPGASCQFVIQPDYEAKCLDGLWSVTSTPGSPCNPPALEPPLLTTTCPDTEPVNASACNYQGPPCIFDHGNCPFADTEALCSGYHWTVNTTYCDPPEPGTDGGVTVADAGARGDR